MTNGKLEAVAAVAIIFVGGNPANAEYYTASGRVEIGFEAIAIGNCRLALPVNCEYDNKTLNMGPAYGSGSVQIIGGETPYLSVPAEASPYQAITVNAELDYRIELEPLTLDYSPVLLDGLVYSGYLRYSYTFVDSFGNSRDARADVTITDMLDNVIFRDGDGYSNITISNDSFSFDFSSVNVDQVYYVSMSALVGVDAFSRPESDYATIDPLFTLAPQYADKYKIVAC